MSKITAKMVKDLRVKTGAGMMDCKGALKEADGDFAKAEEILAEKGVAKAAKKAAKETPEGLISSYIHMDGKVGVLIEVNCQTDFVARNENFRAFVKDLTLQIAAANPICVNKNDACPALQEKLDSASKEEKEQICAESCLLEQKFIKNPEQRIEDLLKSKIAELGENIIIKRFTRYSLGE